MSIGLSKQQPTAPAATIGVPTSSLSDLKNRSENSAERGQILPVLQVNSHSIDQKSGEIWTAQADLQPISFKSDRLLGFAQLLHYRLNSIQSGARNELEHRSKGGQKQHQRGETNDQRDRKTNREQIKLRCAARQN